MTRSKIQSKERDRERESGESELENDLIGSCKDGKMAHGSSGTTHEVIAIGEDISRASHGCGEPPPVLVQHS